MSELEDIRRKKLDQLRQQAQNQEVEEQKIQQQIQTLEIIVKQHLTKDALQRFGNIKAADPEKAVQIMVVIAQLIEKNNIQQINDEQFKQILMQITPKKKEFKIKRK